MGLEIFSLKGRNALVTGSRTGLGKGLALSLAQAGANVVIHGSKPDGLDDVCSMVRAEGGNAVRVVADLADPASHEALIETSIRELGSIDILVNNAGFLRRAPAVDYPIQDWTDVLKVDLDAVFRLSQLAGRPMLARGSGKIINIASVLSFQGGVFVPSYAAAKGAVAQLTKALANEWASKGVNVNAIAPGYMETDATAALRNDPNRSRQIMERIPAGRWGIASDLAGAVIFLASDASNYVHGHLLVVDGGWLAR
jgi:2-deoxy-D-gluconate 3-dehydrogenase